MSRYGDNIRRIARTKELVEQLRDAEQRIKILEKAPINGKRGISYRTLDGSATVNTTGAPGQTNPTGLGDAQPLQNSSVPGGTGGVDDKETDGDDLLQNAPNKGDTVGAINLKDCDTGEAIDVRFDTGGNTGEAIFKHPSGRNPDGSLVEIPDGIFAWEYQKRWRATGGVIGPSGGVSGGPWPTAAAALRAALDQLDTYVNSNSTAYYDAYNASVCHADGHTFRASRWRIRITDIDFSETTLTIRSAHDFSFACGAISDATNSCTFARGSCTVGDIACPALEPARPVFGLEKGFYPPWEAGTTHQLAYSAEHGGFMSSALDSSIPLKYKNPISNYDFTVIGNTPGLSKLDLCTEDDVPVTVEVLKNGEFVYYENDGAGNPDLTTYPMQKYNSKGEYVGTITEDEYESSSL